MPVNTCHNLECLERKLSKTSVHIFTSERGTLDYQSGIKMLAALFQNIHVNSQIRAPETECPLVVLVHAVERRHVKAFAKTKLFGAPARLVRLCAGRLQAIGMTVMPRGVGNLGNDDLWNHSIRRAFPGAIAEIEADRIEHVTKVARMGNQLDFAIRAPAGGAFHVVTHSA